MSHFYSIGYVIVKTQKFKRSDSMDIEKLYDAWAEQTEKRNAYKFAVKRFA